MFGLYAPVFGLRVSRLLVYLQLVFNHLIVICASFLFRWPLVVKNDWPSFFVAVHP